MIIGLCGVARSGKDSFYNFCKDLDFNSNPNFSFAFAEDLKSELNNFLLDSFGITAFTEDSKEKEIIRPMLVSYGMAKREMSNGAYWIKKIFKKILKMDQGVPFCYNNNCFITDVRFENEINAIKKLNGICIYIEREGASPANLEEKNNDPIIRSKADYTFKWKNFTENQFNSGVAKKVAQDFLHKTIDNERRARTH